MVYHCPGVAAAPCFPRGRGRDHFPRDPATCIFSGCIPTRLHKKHALIGDLSLSGERDASGVFCCCCLFVLFCSFLREAFKKTTVTLISDLSGLSRAPLDSWAPLCGGCYLGILPKNSCGGAQSRALRWPGGWGHSWQREGLGEGNGHMKSQPWQRGRQSTEPRWDCLGRLWSWRRCERHFLLGHTFMGKQPEKSKLQKAEAACLCPEEVQNWAPTTLSSAMLPAGFSGKASLPLPILLCITLSPPHWPRDPARVPSSDHCATSLHFDLYGSRQGWDGMGILTFTGLFVTQTAQCSEFLKPLVLDCRFLLDDLGDSGTALQNYWSIGPCSFPHTSTFLLPLERCSPRVLGMFGELLSTCCRLTQSHLSVLIKWPRWRSEFSSGFSPWISGQAENSGLGDQADPLTLAKKLKSPETQLPPTSNGEKSVPALWGCQDCISRV